MFAFGSEIAVVPVDGRSGQISPIRALAKDSLVRTIREWIGIESQVQFVSDANVNVFVPSNMVSTLVGKGGSNIRQLQDELGGISISVKTFEEMPESMERPNPYWEDVQDRRSRASRAWEHSGKSQRRKSRKGRR
jgi:predicted PilT family ATPase